MAARLKTYCGIEAAPLYHPPPDAPQFHSAHAEDFLYFPSRLNALKRQRLVVEALAHTRAKVRVRFPVRTSRPGTMRSAWRWRAEARSTAGSSGWARFPNRSSAIVYARCLGVLFPSLDEDYGYITLEAMLAHKPVIACADSGGPLEFVVDRETGLVCEPSPRELAAAMDELWEDRARARRWGEAGRQRYSDLRIDWGTVLERLLQ